MTGTLSVPQIREQRGIRMVTMKEVAESAGVSIATVSPGRSSESPRTSATGPIWWPAT